MIRKNIFEKMYGVPWGAFVDDVVRRTVRGILDEINNCEVDEDGNFHGEKIKLPRDVDDYIDRWGELIGEEEDPKGRWQSDGWGDKEFICDVLRDLRHGEWCEGLNFKKSGDITFKYRHDKFYEIEFEIQRTPYKHKALVNFKGKLNKGLTPPPPHTVGGWTGRRNDD